MCKHPFTGQDTQQLLAITLIICDNESNDKKTEKERKRDRGIQKNEIKKQRNKQTK